MIQSIKTWFISIRKKNFKYFAEWSKFDIGWLIVSTFLILGASIASFIIYPVEWWLALISVVGSLTGMWCVVAVTKQRISNYIFGLVNVILMGVWYLLITSYGMSLLNLLYFVPMQFHGIIKWSQNMKKPDITKVKTSTKKQKETYIFLTVIGVAIAFLLLWFSQNALMQLGFSPADQGIWFLVLLDAVGLIGNIIAQVLMNYRFIDQWIYWLIIDITQTVYVLLTVILPLFKGELSGLANLPWLIMYLCWLFNAGLGLKKWKTDIKLEQNNK